MKAYEERKKTWPLAQRKHFHPTLEQHQDLNAGTG
jgi:hypothetical protein